MLGAPSTSRVSLSFKSNSMAAESTDKSVETRIENVHTHPPIIPLEIEAVTDVQHIELSWRTWLVVFITGFFT